MDVPTSFLAIFGSAAGLWLAALTAPPFVLAFVWSSAGSPWRSPPA